LQLGADSMVGRCGKILDVFFLDATDPTLTQGVHCPRSVIRVIDQVSTRCYFASWLNSTPNTEYKLMLCASSRPSSIFVSSFYRGYPKRSVRRVNCNLISSRTAACVFCKCHIRGIFEHTCVLVGSKRV
jgi:hypothetical protein